MRPTISDELLDYLGTCYVALVDGELIPAYYTFERYVEVYKATGRICAVDHLRPWPPVGGEVIRAIKEAG